MNTPGLYYFIYIYFFSLVTCAIHFRIQYSLNPKSLLVSCWLCHNLLWRSSCPEFISLLVDPYLKGHLLLLTWALFPVPSKLLECFIGPCVPVLPVCYASPKPQYSGMVQQYLIHSFCSAHLWYLVHSWHKRPSPTSPMMFSSDQWLHCDHSITHCYLRLCRYLSWMHCLHQSSCFFNRIHIHICICVCNCVCYRVCVHVHVWCIRFLHGL